jgi:putative SOS response-associated peptidase YedK
MRRSVRIVGHPDIPAAGNLSTSGTSRLKTGYAVSCGDSLGIRQQDPFWAKNANMGLSTINAKAATIATAPAFREAFKTRRCLVPADAFYKWQKIDAKTKQPFAIGMKDGSPCAFAGLRDRWRDPATKERLETFTVTTTEPDEVVEPMHNRMPVIIQPKE